ncbi:uncharacterized protein LACBIDRAFT_316435 [Laccaria bicolor S238N-H82]|uniref:Predicted protein n=1 Tax=Laccaria bicolor (strain S238N-H82 / ATCC MYA-4686) TaxID=486041 RepID=B0E0Y7_LACBS|nr:uncharacterized protein LACBIDRAFT_316435 [Laccaria bicolor S238N-H82]EDQ99524.1 predicted protein [Laccaria bicolor S238N-H82]|eukprot:XP_001889873.1 predicted protein [Laccaria bicolor S238N-H82]
MTRFHWAVATHLFSQHLCSFSMEMFGNPSLTLETQGSHFWHWVFLHKVQHLLTLARPATGLSDVRTSERIDSAWWSSV